jgi:putative ATP-binding cassette transporter
MDSDTFAPSVDWGNELLASSLWVVQAVAVSAVLLVVVLVLLCRFTGWGRQFWRLNGPYFTTGRASLVVWSMVLALLISAVLSVRVSVLLSYYANDLFSSLQAAFEGNGASDGSLRETGIDGFWASMRIFAVLATVATVRSLLDLYLMQRFSIRWRVWLTGRIVEDWLGGYAYYRGQLTSHDEPTDPGDAPTGHRTIFRRRRAHRGRRGPHARRPSAHRCAGPAPRTGRQRGDHGSVGLR